MARALRTPWRRRKTKREKLTGLWLRQKGKCCWCGQKMIFPGAFTLRDGEKFPDAFCTLEHIHDRYDPKRGTQAGRYVNKAACFRCNNDRNKARQAQIPLSELHRRSGAGLVSERGSR